MTSELALNPEIQFLTDDDAHDISGGSFLLGVAGGLVGAAIYAGADAYVKRKTGQSIGEHIADGIEQLFG